MLSLRCVCVKKKKRLHHSAVPRGVAVASIETTGLASDCSCFFEFLFLFCFTVRGEYEEVEIEVEEEESSKREQEGGPIPETRQVSASPL